MAAMASRHSSPVDEPSAAGRSRREHKAPAAYDPSEEAARAQWGGKDVAPPGPKIRRASPAPRPEAAAQPKKVARTNSAGAVPQRSVSPPAPHWENEMVSAACSLLSGHTQPAEPGTAEQTHAAA